jgi:hypothetical protein
MKVQCADVKKALCSVHRTNLAGNVVVLDGRRSHMQNRGSGQRTKIHYEDGQYAMYLWLPSKSEEAQKETEKGLKGRRFAILATECEQVFSWRVCCRHQDEQEGQTDKRGNVMEEVLESVWREFKRGRREREKERERARDRGRGSASESEEDRDGSEPEEGGRAQLGPRSVQELVPTLREGKSRIVRAGEEGSERGRCTVNRDRLHVHAQRAGEGRVERYAISGGKR